MDHIERGYPHHLSAMRAATDSAAERIRQEAEKIHADLQDARQGEPTAREDGAAPDV